MPVKTCRADGKSGYKWGDEGKCYTHDGSDAGKKRAKKQALKQAVAIGGGSMPSFAENADTRDMPPELETVDLENVDIMAAGEKVRGQDSPPGGETFTEDDLQQIADASNAVLDRASPFVKLGHSKEQRLARASGLYDEDERPATGWIKNFRVENGKLYTDWKDVPKKLAQLVKARAFAKRSVELSKFRDPDDDEKVYPAVVRAVSLLGAKAPAFKTLDDIHAMFAGDDHPTRELLYADAEPPDDQDLRIVEYAAGDIIWQPEQSYQDLLGDLNELLRPMNTDEMVSVWAQDVSIDRTRALICEGGNDYWVAPIVIGADGEPSISDRSQWTMAEQAWVEASTGEQASEASETTGSGSEFSERGRKPRRAADTRGMPKNDKPDTVELSEEQAAAFSELLGLDEFDAAKARDAIAALKAKAETDGGDGGGDGGTGDEGSTGDGETKVPEGMRLMSEADIDAIKGLAKEGVGAAEKLRLMERGTVIETAARDGRINPSKEERERWEKRYDEAPEITKELLSELPVNEEFKKVYGADPEDDLEEGGTKELADEAEVYRLFGEMGIPYMPTPTVAALMQRTGESQ